MEDQVTQTGDQGAGAQTDASQSLGWRAALPDEFKEHEYVKGFAKPGDFVKSALDLKTENDTLKTRLDGAIIKPGDDATDEQWAAYRAALGVPDSPDLYEFQKIEMPDGIPYNDELDTWFREFAHGVNMPKDMAAKLYDGYNKVVLDAYQRQKTIHEKALSDERTKGMAALKEEWANKFDENVKIVQTVQEKIGMSDPEMKDWLAAHNAGNDPVLIKWLLKNAHTYISDTAPPGKPGGSKEKEGMNYKVPNPPPI